MWGYEFAMSFFSGAIVLDVRLNVCGLRGSLDFLFFTWQMAR